MSTWRAARQPGGLDLRDFLGQHQPDFRIFVAQIEIDGRRLHHPSGDQHAFDEPMRIALQIIAILEGAGLALVAVDRHQAGCRLRPDQGPFAPGRETGAAKATQAGVADRLDDVVPGPNFRQACFQQRIAAIGPIGGKILAGLVGMERELPPRRPRQFFRATHGITCTCPTAATGARSQAPTQGARKTRTVGAELSRKRRQQPLGARHGAGQAVAYPHRDGRRRRAVLYDVEMRVKGRDFVDLRLGELHLLGKRRQMGR